MGAIDILNCATTFPADKALILSKIARTSVWASTPSSYEVFEAIYQHATRLGLNFHWFVLHFAVLSGSVKNFWLTGMEWSVWVQIAGMKPPWLVPTTVEVKKASKDQYKGMYYHAPQVFNVDVYQKGDCYLYYFDNNGLARDGETRAGRRVKAGNGWTFISGACELRAAHPQSQWLGEGFIVGGVP